MRAFLSYIAPFGMVFSLCLAGCGDDTGIFPHAKDAATLVEDAGIEAPPAEDTATAIDSGTVVLDGGLIAPATATIIVLPDTQYYTYSAASGFYTAPDHAGVFGEQIDWILASRNSLNIQAVLHVGDIVDIPDDAEQWKIAGTAMHRLDGLIPYVVVPGNHDSDAKRSGPMDRHFGPETMPWITGTEIIGQMENNYALVDIGGKPWLVVALEFSPTDATVAWADKVLKAYPDRTAILLTHAYLYSDGTRYDLSVAGTDESQSTYQYWYPQRYAFTPSEGMNDGEMLYQKLVSPNSNVRLVFSGHQTGVTGGARLTSTRPDGTVVHQMLSDYQWLNGEWYGYGYLRIVQLDFAGQTIRIRTYSPDLNQYLADDTNQFDLPMNL